MNFDDPVRQRLATRFDSYVQISIGDGWLPLVDELDNRLMALTGGYTLLQIKEKFGGLRYYATFPRDLMDECQVLVKAAEEASGYICEHCGALAVPEPPSPTRWHRTLCAACWEEKLSAV